VERELTVTRRQVATEALRNGAGPLEALIEATEHPYPWQGDSPFTVDLPDAGLEFVLKLALEPDAEYAVEWLGEWPEPLPETSPEDDIAKWCAAAGGNEETAAWWSIPLSRNVLVTSRAVQQVPLLLLAGEDDLGRVDAVVHRMELPSAPRLYEVDSPDAWTTLVQLAPMDVTKSKGFTWGKSTTAAASWLLPNWSEIARNFDAVHLTVDGYLDTAGRPLPVDGGVTMLAGMSPDATVWLRGPLQSLENQRVHRSEETWEMAR
jgi:hypothetical protein